MMRKQSKPSRGDRAATVALALYPPAWRDRYGDEVRALLADSGGGVRAVLSLACRALPAWLWPAGHLHDRDGRIRASLGTFLLAWSALAGVSLVFVQLTQFQGFRPAGHPIVSWCYAIADAGLAVSLVAAVAGCLPLWLLMLRRARRERRPRQTAGLLLPVIAPVTYLAVVIAATSGTRAAAGLSAPEFGVFVLLGFAAAAAACLGPILAMRRLRPRGPAVRVAACAAGISAAAIAVTGLASSIAAVGLCLWARDFAAYHQAGQLTGFLAVVGAAALTATVSAARGMRALTSSRGR